VKSKKRGEKAGGKGSAVEKEGSPAAAGEGRTGLDLSAQLREAIVLLAFCGFPEDFDRLGISAQKISRVQKGAILVGPALSTDRDEPPRIKRPSLITCSACTDNMPAQKQSPSKLVWLLSVRELDHIFVAG
jgi:hypothetical protein